MYADIVKPVTVTMPEELDRRAAAEARRRGISKSELVRQGLEAVLAVDDRDPESSDDDIWRRLAGFGSPDVVIEPGEIDRIVYGF